MEGDNMRWKEMPQPIKVRLVTSFFNRTISFAIMPFMALLFVQAYNKVFAGIFLIGTVILSQLPDWFDWRLPRRSVSPETPARLVDDGDRIDVFGDDDQSRQRSHAALYDRLRHFHRDEQHRSTGDECDHY